MLDLVVQLAILVCAIDNSDHFVIPLVNGSNDNDYNLIYMLAIGGGWQMLSHLLNWRAKSPYGRKTARKRHLLWACGALVIIAAGLLAYLGLAIIGSYFNNVASTVIEMLGTILSVVLGITLYLGFVLIPLSVVLYIAYMVICFFELFSVKR